MVDWSGGNGRRPRKQDAIWIAHGSFSAETPHTDGPASRSEAEALLRSLLEPFASGNAASRALVCFDFAYGYPSGFASCLLAPGDGPPWRGVWNYLSQELIDDIGSKSGRLPTNRSNRFDLANGINRSLSPNNESPGPFWCLFSAGSQPFVPQQQPGQPFRNRRGSTFDSLRITDRRVGSDTAFRLFGTGSVGSQVLTGIPRVRSLRDHPSLRAVSKVWPFETGWASDKAWLQGVRILHAEIYPSVREPFEDVIKDRGQVRAMWEWARSQDRAENLLQSFQIPTAIAEGSEEERRILSEEGWILGTPR